MLHMISVFHGSPHHFKIGDFQNTVLLYGLKNPSVMLVTCGPNNTCMDSFYMCILVQAQICFFSVSLDCAFCKQECEFHNEAQNVFLTVSFISHRK